MFDKKRCRDNCEWFDLSHDDINEIIEFVSDKTVPIPERINMDRFESIL